MNKYMTIRSIKTGSTMAISKSLFLEGLRCPRLFWLRVNRPQLAAPAEGMTQYLLNVGKTVGRYAHGLFPGGVLVGNDDGDFGKALSATQGELNGSAGTLFEPAFETDYHRCRIDVLECGRKEGIVLTEVKSTTDVDPMHIPDTAFQASVLQDSGLSPARYNLMHLNPDYVRTGAINPMDLFRSVDISAQVWEYIDTITPAIDNMLRMAHEPEPPGVIFSGRCNRPGKCPWQAFCRSQLPEFSVYDLPYGYHAIPHLLRNGILRLVDIPDSWKLTYRQASVVRSAKSGAPVINRAGVRNFLSSLTYPICYLDFETVSPPLPPYDNTYPFCKIPFQVSIHVQRAKGGEAIHYEYLAPSAVDPRREVLDFLLRHVPDSGTVLTYNMTFEKSVLLELARVFPEHAGKLENMVGRLADLIVPFRSGDYTDAQFSGSVSIKHVLPVLVPGLSYSGRRISNGEEACVCFQLLLLDGDMSPSEWEELREDLLRYCELDTLGMVEILRVLYSVC